MLVIEGNPRTAGTVGFTPEILSVLEVVPPTEQSLRVAKSIGVELGQQLVETAMGDFSASQVGIDIFERHKLPFETYLALMRGTAETMDNVVSTSRSTGERLLDGKQRSAFNNLLGAVIGINNAQEVHPA